MNNKIKVCAIVTVYNNITEVKAITSSLYLQTRPIDCLIYVDNSDDKYKFDIRNYILSVSVNKNVIYIKTKKNIGSAGGFAIGMQYAVLNNFDFIWLNDQDGIPSEDCLFNLLEVYNLNSSASVYSPLILSTENKAELLYFRSKLNIFLNYLDYVNRNNCFKIDVVGTTGILIHKSIINNIGVYNDEICFVGNEDIEYSLRLAKNKINIYCVRKAVYYHPDLFIKHNNKKSLVKKLPIIKHLIPLFFGYTFNNNQISYYNTLSMSFINYAYGHIIFKQLNIVYSILRLLLAKIFDNKINTLETLIIYCSGILLTKKYSYYYFSNINDKIDYIENINAN